MGPVRSLIREAIRANPTMPRVVWQAVYPLFQKNWHWPGVEYTDRASAFTTIYKDNRWGSAESVSGRGSTLENTGTVRTILPKLMADLKVGTFLDAPCGDFNWARHVVFPDGTNYIGGDIVDDLIANLQTRYGDHCHNFINLDIVDGKLPAADFWLCRHVLFHLSNDDIKATLANFAASSIAWLLTDSLSAVNENIAIKSGGFRLINLRAPPFNLPRPIRSFPDYYPPNAPVHLCLWSRAQVAQAVGKWSSAAATD